MPPDSGILVVASCSEGRIDPETYDLLAFSEQLQRLRPNLGVHVLIIGEGLEDTATDIAKMGGVDVSLVETPGIPHYVNEAYRNIVAGAIHSAAPAYVVAAHNSRGWEWAPSVAARLGAACIAGVNGICAEADALCFLRDIYGGKVKERCAPRTEVALITVLPGVFKFDLSETRPPGRVMRTAAGLQLKRTRFLGSRQAGVSKAGITEAPIVVSVGNGIGDRENLQRVYELARLLPRAVVSGTRILCDRGWLDYDQQVGVTGATVAPSLYIALGISGAAQHVSGMRASGFVIAVNTDPRAPIFNEADVGIVEDINRFIPLVLETYEAQGGSGSITTQLSGFVLPQSE
jgi:electron transfer flavoprotein alpha subunit